MEAEAAATLSPVMAIALVGGLGVGSQWLAWRLRVPAIVLMLGAGVLVGPVLGIFDPARDIGALTGPIISIAVAVILFEGGLTLNFRGLADAAEGVRRLVVVGAPLGWLLAALALHFGAGLSWESSAVFGGILIVTGPTVIAPLLRQARLARRPALLLQWEAIVNDPIGALAAVLAFEVVLVLYTAERFSEAMINLALGVGTAIVLGASAGFLLARSFRGGGVPEYMKVSVLFTTLLIVFAVSNFVLHESGLLAVTIMGIVIANADLPSYEELRRFKEHATVLLVSGVFILLAASLDFSALGQLTWRAALLVALIVLGARPITVFASLAMTRVPIRERILVALTGPRGVVLVAVAGLFGDRLTALGVADGALIGPLAFVLVAATVVVHGFSLGPFARALGLTGGETLGVLIVGGSPWATAFARALQRADVPVLVADTNPGHLHAARDKSIPTFHGDILSEAAEHTVELVSFGSIVAATGNDAYNTLVATDLGPDFGRDNAFQVARITPHGARHALPASLGGRRFGAAETIETLNDKIEAGWYFTIDKLAETDKLEDWRKAHPDAIPIAQILTQGEMRMVTAGDQADDKAVAQVIAMSSAG